MQSTDHLGGSPDHSPDDEQGRNLLDRLILRIGNLLSLLFIFTVAISFYEIVMRYIFNAPTMWVHESASFIGGSLFVVGGAYALANNKHVRVVLIYDQVSERTRHYLNIFHHLAGLAFTGMLVYGAWEITYSSWVTPFGDIRLETSGSAWDPAFPSLLKAVILVVVCIMFIQFLLHLINEVSRLKALTHRGRHHV